MYDRRRNARSGGDPCISVKKAIRILLRSRLFISTFVIICIVIWALKITFYPSSKLKLTTKTADILLSARHQEQSNHIAHTVTIMRPPEMPQKQHGEPEAKQTEQNHSSYKQIPEAIDSAAENKTLIQRVQDFGGKIKNLSQELGRHLLPNSNRSMNSVQTTKMLRLYTNMSLSNNTAIQPIDVFSYLVKHHKLNDSLAKHRLSMSGLVARQLDTLYNKTRDNSSEYVQVLRSGGVCQCDVYNCQCCSTVNLPELHYKHYVCLNLTYFTKDQEMQLKVIQDGKHLLNTTSPVNRATELCLQPHPLVALCTSLSNVTRSVQKHEPKFKMHLTGCAALKLELRQMLVSLVPLGCFKMPDHSHLKEPQNAPHNLGNFVP